MRYLSRRHHVEGAEARPQHKLLADLVRQPSSRVRTALIALLLAHPDYAASIPAAIQDLTLSAARTLKILYTAAVHLQRQHADRLQEFLGTNWRWLPDMFSDELGVRGATPLTRLQSLGRIHAVERRASQLGRNLKTRRIFCCDDGKWSKYGNSNIKLEDFASLMDPGGTP
ncbi:hypothetical protein [Candidatus Amarolinea dominans]|uniref:hypothetical protein n=1 Tax=Candidatus Amarolinea dominans TaxID=3140696 RepID=UPI001DD10FA1|nr:hypothetical protein [Anaerolineae bacterium]